MKCPDCGSMTTVFKVRTIFDGTARIRQRHCPACKSRTLTTEVITRRMADPRSMSRVERDMQAEPKAQ